MNAHNICAFKGNCDVCGTIFENERMLRNHLRQEYKSHPERKWLKCLECNESFTAEPLLFLHLAVKHEICEWICQARHKATNTTCGYRVNNRRLINDHAKRIHEVMITPEKIKVMMQPYYKNGSIIRKLFNELYTG